MEATTLRQLTAYTAVARAASFTAAAAEMHVSQSSLSRAVADLERQLGVQLLERDTRNVQLTAAGVEALRIAEQIVTAHRAGMKELRRFLLGESGTVAVATLPSVAAVLLPQVISDFRERRPQVAVRLLDGLERLVLDRVLSGDADFAITTVGDPPSSWSTAPWSGTASSRCCRKATRSPTATKSPGTTWLVSRSWPSGATRACAGSPTRRSPRSTRTRHRRPRRAVSRPWADW
jgi:DNA-binding transcriptional LysR family regulator